MGSLVSLMISNMYIKHFEEVALRTAENPPRLWGRLVYETLIVQWLECKGNILKHINNIDQSITFTVEDTYPHGSMPNISNKISPITRLTTTTATAATTNLKDI